MANWSDRLELAGLGTTSTICLEDGLYTIEGRITHPQLNLDGNVSEALPVVNVNGSPVYTGTAGDQGFSVTTPLVATDTVEISITSSAACDQPINAVKTNATVSSRQ